MCLYPATGAVGASWGDNGNIVAALTSTGGLSRVPASGGAPQTLTKPRGETSHRWPQILPGGNAILFTGGNFAGGWDDANIEVVSLKTDETKVLLRDGYFARYLPTGSASTNGTGHLVYVHGGVLFGVPFDPVKLEVHGTPMPLIEDMAGNTTNGAGEFDFSRTGTLVYLRGKSGGPTWPVVWLENSGKIQPLLAEPGVYITPRFSPDGNWLALGVNTGKGSDIYVYDWHHDTMPRLTTTARANQAPVWAPDGKHIAFSSIDGLWWVRADGAGEAQRLLASNNPVASYSFSPDGRRLAYTEQNPETHDDILILPLELSDPEHPKPGMPEPFLRTPSNERDGTFSPDGRWMAYASDESGSSEVYVRPFPGTAGKWQISTSGGTVPMWSRDGRELFYANLDNRIMVAEVTAKGDSFSYSKRRLWSDRQILDAGGRRYFDLAPDGKRFAVLARPETNEEKPGNVHITFLLNFFDDLRRRMPTGK